ncbi:MAG: hypothetical protein HZC49_09195, partial [Nitrospirae bacterium]|nr:hypothetical protein [Nitrospirota bacterium]
MKSILRPILLSLILVLAAVQAHSRDYPHFGNNNIGCDSCHFVYGTQPSLLPPWTEHTPQDIDDTPYNMLCWSCHNEIEAPYVRTHSSLQIDNGYGDWTIECRKCHDPHTQFQLRTYGSAGFLYQGTVSNVDATSLKENGATWTVNQYKGFVVVPNKTDVRFNYKIVSNTIDTLTIQGPVDLSRVAAGNSFAIVYGKLIESTLATPNSGSKAVKF